MKSLIFLLLVVVAVASQVPPYEKQTFCKRDRCLTCVGKYCTTTCRGPGCEDCHYGDCCDGTKCNICRGSRCCKDLDCNTCVISCLKLCKDKATCHYDCFRDCLSEDEWKQEETARQKSIIISNTKSYLPVNVTTIINITNTVKNENTVYNPVVVNTTNIYNHTLNTTRVIVNESPENGEGNNGKEVLKPDNGKRSCCDVVHPETCKQQSETSEEVCNIAKHNECSQLCTAKHIHIVETTKKNLPCIYVGIKPFYYCDKYEALNCDNCYDCADNDQLTCAQSSNCSNECRRGIMSNGFYNMLRVKPSN